MKRYRKTRGQRPRLTMKRRRQWQLLFFDIEDPRGIQILREVEGQMCQVEKLMGIPAHMAKIVIPPI